MEAIFAPGGATPAEETACGAAATYTNGGSGELRAQKPRKAPPPEVEAITTEKIVKLNTEPEQRGESRDDDHKPNTVS